MKKIKLVTMEKILNEIKEEFTRKVSDSHKLNRELIVEEYIPSLLCHSSLSLSLEHLIGKYNTYIRNYGGFN